LIASIFDFLQAKNERGHLSKKGDERGVALVSLIVFSFSLIVYEFYYAGDQIAYHSAYDVVPGLNLSEAMELYNQHVSSAEYVHFLFSYIGSTLGVDKNLWFSAWNSLFSILIMRFFISRGVPFWLSTAIVFTNFYVLVLYFAAERLKFGFLFMSVALLPEVGVVSAVFFAILSVFSHFSMLFPVLSISLVKVYDFYCEYKFSFIFLCCVFFLLLAPFGIFFYFNFDYVAWKVSFYLVELSFYSIVPILPVLGLLCVAIIQCRDWVRPFLAFLPLIVGVLLLGGDRLNMFVFFYYVWFSNDSRFSRYVLIILCMYFLPKSILFLGGIFSVGSGFS
tara:strand:+ start:2554 stop:3558 length:1005 start_codon:yes stop_codon:yes gene_type:complete